MYTEKNLTRQLEQLGIEKSDTLIVHTSLKSIGIIDDSDKSGADVLISALRNAVSDGLATCPLFYICEYKTNTDI